MVQFIDLVSLRPIRRKDGSKAVLLADGALLPVRTVQCLGGYLGDGKWMGEALPMYLWRIGFVLALVRAGYKVLSAEHHVIAVTKLPTDVTPLSERRLVSEALNAKIALDNAAGATN
jgi:hypothetical protein